MADCNCPRDWIACFMSNCPRAKTHHDALQEAHKRFHAMNKADKP